MFPGKEMFIAAGFGLIHGMAFASVLTGFNLHAGTLAISILGFNIRIELMQLTVVACVVPWLIILSKKELYKWIRMICSITAGIAAVAWIAERISLTENIVAESVQELFNYAPAMICTLALLALYVSLRQKEGAHENR
ncbi:MAG: HupE/UreJ family protein [Bacteroidetes bacterium]|nr:HupE/UreJ family protein [Bacteroidota bacterium]